jgi:hypothetical protein
MFSARLPNTSIRFRHQLWICVLYLVLAVSIASNALQDPFHRFLGGPGDPQQFMWYLHWFWYALTHGQNPLQTEWLNAPYGQNLMWNTSILSISFLFGWLTVLVNATFLYNALWALNFVLACWLGQQLVALFSVRRWFTVVGGVLMGILPYSTAQSLFHLHLWFTAVPLALIWWLVAGFMRGVRRPVPYGIVLGLLAICQFYTSIEIFTTFVLVTAVFVLVHVVVGVPTRLRLLRFIPRPSLVAVSVTFMVFAAPGVYFLLFGADRPLGHLLKEDLYVNDLLNFILPTPVYALHSAYTTAVSLHYTGNYWENNGYLGIICICLLVLALPLWYKRPFARSAWVTLILTALLSMGPHLHIAGQRTDIWLPWSLLQHVPFINSAIPSRLMMYGDILVVVLLVTAGETWLRRNNTLFGHAVVWIAVAGVLVTWFPETPFPTTDTPDAAAALQPGNPVAEAVHGQPTLVLTPDPSVVMQANAESEFVFPMVNPYGYTANSLQRQAALREMSRLAWDRLTEADALQILHMDLPGLGARRLLYYPNTPDEALPDVVVRAIDKVCGHPVAISHGALVWKVPTADSRGE